MKKILIIFVLLTSIFLVNTSYAQNPYAAPATVQVRGYTRSNGTYVQPHTRTAPDGIKSNNKSYTGYKSYGGF